MNTTHNQKHAVSFDVSDGLYPVTDARSSVGITAFQFVPDELPSGRIYYNRRTGVVAEAGQTHAGGTI